MSTNVIAKNSFESNVVYYKNKRQQRINAISATRMNPPAATEKELFEHGGYRDVVNWDGYNMPWPFHAEKADIKQLEIFSDDVIVASLPRCGTTWTQELVWLILHDGDIQTAQATDLGRRFPFLETTTIGNSSVDAIQATPRPRTIKTHLGYEALPTQVESVRPKIVYVARNPKDFAWSLYCFAKQCTENSQPSGYTFEDFARVLMGEKAPFGPTFKHILGYWNRHSSAHENIFFLTYEQLQTNYLATLRKLAIFLNKPHMTDKVLEKIEKFCLFENFKNNPRINFVLNMKDSVEANEYFRDGGATFLRKGQVGNWKEHFSSKLNAEYDAWIEKNLSGTRLKFLYE